MPKPKRNVHVSGALAAMLNAGDIATLDSVSQKKQTDVKTATPNRNSRQAQTSQVLLVDPKKIKNWDLHDRPEAEMGDISSLADDLKSNGQIQPCLVRPFADLGSPYKYELIVGERRWRATKRAGIQLKVLVEDLTDSDAAIKQASENIERKDLSDYARGLNYAALIKAKIVTRQNLMDRLNISKTDLSRLLSFADVPKEIWDVITDKTKISARMASEIRALAFKSPQHVAALIQLAPRLSAGKLGVKNLQAAIDRLLNKNATESLVSQEVKNHSGRHLFTWRKDSNGNLSISFPKDIRTTLHITTIEEALIKTLDDHLITVSMNRLNEETKT